MRFFHKMFQKSSCTCALRIERTQHEGPKPFSQIPGPAVLPIVGSTWKYFPFIGDWRVDRLHETGRRRHAEFGPIVREQIPGGLTMVHLYRAEDIGTLHQTEGEYPARRSHLAIGHYRTSRPHLYNSGGLIPENGSTWWRLRSAFQKSLSRIEDARNFLPTADSIIEEFLSETISDEMRVDDFLPLVSRLFLEIMWMVLFGKRLHSFNSANLNEESLPSRLIAATETANGSILATDSTEQIWKYIRTPSYKTMETSLAFIEKAVLEALKIKMEEISKRGPSESGDSLVEKYLENPEVDIKDIHGMVVDLVLGGVDTTAYTTCFLVYRCAVTPLVQARLRSESLDLLPQDNSQVTPAVLSQCSYTKAVMKELFRLNPISVGTSRFLHQDTIFSGYLVPKGTLVMTQNMVACRDEANFRNASRFLPERWLKGSSDHQSVSPYLVLPFSHGRRTCIARRLSEQNFLNLILKMFRRYHLIWLGGTLDVITPIICKPDRPVSLQFYSWDNPLLSESTKCTH